MQKWKTSLLLVVLAAVSLAQTASQVSSADMRRIGVKLACLCGCKSTVADCTMLECGYSKPARDKIAAGLLAGKSDAEIINSFVQESGLQALAVPPAEGFNLMAWVMPFIAIALGLVALTLFIRRFHPKRAAATAPEVDPALLERYHDRIEEDLEKLDR